MPVFRFWLYLMLTNGLVMLPEIYVVKMTFWQSLVARSGTIVPNILIACLFADRNNFSVALDRFVGKVLRTQRKSLISGVKLALIGPQIYLIKLFILNIAVFPWIKWLADPIDPAVVYRAYFYSLAAFLPIGFVYGLYLEGSWKHLFAFCIPQNKQQT